MKRKEYNGFCERCGKRLETSRYTIKLCESCRMEEFDKIMCELNDDWIEKLEEIKQRIKEE